MLQQKMKKYLLLLIALLFGTVSLLSLIRCSEAKKENGNPYEVGFKIVHALDTLRIYRPGTDSTNYLHYRPIDIDIWYPAKSSDKDSPLVFRDILGLLETRANYYTDSKMGNGITQQIAQSLCSGFKCSDTIKLLNYRTVTIKNALAIDEKFPLVIYLCAYNGMSFENFALFEELAKKGFVVASISSIGRFPGDMTMKKEDLMEQVNDAITSLNISKKNSSIDLSKIGIIGYSWGGLAGAVLATKITNAACMISLDGSEFHHYGEAKDENADFNNTRYSPEFASIHLSLPYLRLESSPLSHNDKEDSIYNFSEKLTGEKSIFKIDSTEHEDFSCLSDIVRVSGNCKAHQYFHTISKLTIGFLEKYLKNNNNSFSEIVTQEMGKTISRK
jgi:hypothetical protein